MDKTELNHLAALKVMGWEVNYIARGGTCYKGEDAPSLYNFVSGAADYWDPCTYIDHALKLVDKLDVRRIGFSKNRNTDKWSATVWLGPMGNLDYFRSEECDTRELALTLACLQAVGEKI